ncbi:hypothetical protein [Promicromonospora panici]|uniref:hypothetical protein n=1 Tax=Promicromonospora panici TaxID=2219658 RepID=UPI00101D6E22|nr:hypothetical protein [Promicromonospora panici]
MALSAGLVVTGATGASAIAVSEVGDPEVISAPATDPVPDVPEGLPVDGLLGAVPDTIAGLISAILSTLGLAAPLPPGTPSGGDGAWSPSHDEEAAIIPICSGPTTTLDWLFVNFSDHGNDLGLFLKTNSDHIKQVVTASANPHQTLRYLLTPFLQVPVYAINDTVFHQSATLGDVLAFCESART